MAEGYAAEPQAVLSFPIVDALVLRPRSLLVLRAPTGDQKPGALFMHPDLTGHEILAEIDGIHAAFPGRLAIEAPQ